MQASEVGELKWFGLNLEGRWRESGGSQSSCSSIRMVHNLALCCPTVQGRKERRPPRVVRPLLRIIACFSASIIRAFPLGVWAPCRGKESQTGIPREVPVPPFHEGVYGAMEAHVPPPDGRRPGGGGRVRVLAALPSPKGRTVCLPLGRCPGLRFSF